MYKFTDKGRFYDIGEPIIEKGPRGEPFSYYFQALGLPVKVGVGVLRGGSSLSPHALSYQRLA